MKTTTIKMKIIMIMVLITNQIMNIQTLINVANVNILIVVQNVMKIDAITTTGKITAIKNKKEKNDVVTTQYFGLLDVVDN